MTQCHWYDPQIRGRQYWRSFSISRRSATCSRTLIKCSSIYIYIFFFFQQTTEIWMIVSSTKTKEMLIRRAPNFSIPHVVFNSVPIERVHTFKLLGVHNWSGITMLMRSRPKLHRIPLVFPEATNDSDIGDLLWIYNTVLRSVLDNLSKLLKYD